MPRMHPAKLDLAFSDGARPHFYFAWGCFRNFGSRLSDAPRPGHEAVNASHRGEVIQLDAPHPVERRMQACKAPAGRGNRFQWLVDTCSAKAIPRAPQGRQRRPGPGSQTWCQSKTGRTSPCLHCSTGKSAGWPSAACSSRQSPTRCATTRSFLGRPTVISLTSV